VRDEGFGHICDIKSDIWDLDKILDPLRDLESGLDLIWTLVGDLESGYRSGIQIEIWDPN